MQFSFWSDKDQLFVPRTLGFGVSPNLKYIARHLGLIKPSKPPASEAAQGEEEPPARESREERLKRQIQSSKYEET